jgi:PIN domain nuclease of toxin-antitoxin system
MRLLLDMHSFLWFVLNEPQLSSTAQILISDPANDILISPASYWEIAIKVGLGKLNLHAPTTISCSGGSLATTSISCPSSQDTPAS